jgi:steroid delta-isomerase-like uncharacterized protein
MGENAAFGRRFFELWNQRDFDGLAALYTEDATISDLPGGVTMHGPEGAKHEAARWSTPFADGSVEVRKEIAGPSEVAVEAIFRGTNTGPMEGPQGARPATNRRVEFPFVVIWEVSSGHVKEQRAYYDSASLMRQLGLMPEPAGAIA